MPNLAATDRREDVDGVVRPKFIVELIFKVDDLPAIDEHLHVGQQPPVFVQKFWVHRGIFCNKRLDQVLGIGSRHELDFNGFLPDDWSQGGVKVDFHALHFLHSSLWRFTYEFKGIG